MVWLWILGVLAALIVLLCLTRVGVLANMEGEEIRLDAKVGLIRINLLPGKEKTKKEKKPKAKKAVAGGGEKKKTALPKLTLADIKDAVKTLWPPLRRALNRTRRGIRIQPLQLGVTLGGSEDPAATAELYGYLHAGMWTAMPALEQLLVIPDPYLHLGIDFNTQKTTVKGTLGISIRIGTLLAVAFGVGFPALKWFLRFRKKNKQAAAAPQATDAPAA